MGEGVGALFARAQAARRASLLARERAKALSDALLRFERTMGAHPLGRLTLLTDGSGKVLRPSGTVAHWLNVSIARLAGAMLLHFVSRRDTRAFRGLVQTLGYRQGDQEITVHFRPRGGRQQLVRASVAPVGPNTYEWTLRVVRSDRSA